MNDLLAYHGDPTIKDALLAKLAARRVDDKATREDCGCTQMGKNPSNYEKRFGLPQMLIALQTEFAKNQPQESIKLLPERFLSAFVPGRDYSRVGWQFLYWLLTDSSINPGIDHYLVHSAVKQCADIIYAKTKGIYILERDAAAAELAARGAAERVTMSAEGQSTDQIAWSAASAANAAENAAWSAKVSIKSPEGAAKGAIWAVEVAAWGAETASWATKSASGQEWSEVRADATTAKGAAYAMMSNKLIELIEEIQ